MFGKLNTFHPVSGISLAPGQKGHRVWDASGRFFLSPETMIHSFRRGSNLSSKKPSAPALMLSYLVYSAQYWFAFAKSWSDVVIP